MPTTSAAPRRPEPCALVVFGGSGDLTRRTRLPSLSTMARKGLLPERFAVLGTGATPYDDGSFRERFADAVHGFCASPIAEALLGRLTGAAPSLQGRFTDPEEYGRLRTRLDEIDAGHGTAGNRLSRLATPPASFDTVAAHPGATGMVRRQEAERPDFPNHAAGSWGPRAAADLLARDGRCWIGPEDEG